MNFEHADVSEGKSNRKWLAIKADSICRRASWLLEVTYCGPGPDPRLALCGLSALKGEAIYISPCFLFLFGPPTWPPAVRLKRK